MSILKKVPRGLVVLLAMAVFAFLIVRFTRDTGYFYYSIGGAVLLTAGIIFVLYRRPRSTERPDRKARTKSDAGEETAESAGSGEYQPDIIPIEEDKTDIPPARRSGLKTGPADPAARSVVNEVLSKETAVPSNRNASPAGETETDEPVQPPVPLIEDASSLTEEEKNDLVNAVWYRCENPYCKYTHFLGVHHIVEEEKGGANKLDNLIVLCPYCHDLAHRGEIPEKLLREWTADKEGRFKHKLQWHYF